MVENEKKCVCGNKMTKREYTYEWVCHKCGRKRPMEKKKTNADKIRSMTDEELGEFLYLATRCCNEYDCEKCPIGDENCPNMISWLQEESD